MCRKAVFTTWYRVLYLEFGMYAIWMMQLLLLNFEFIAHIAYILEFSVHFFPCISWVLFEAWFVFILNCNHDMELFEVVSYMIWWYLASDLNVLKYHSIL